MTADMFQFRKLNSKFDNSLHISYLHDLNSNPCQTRAHFICDKLLDTIDYYLLYEALSLSKKTRLCIN